MTYDLREQHCAYAMRQPTKRSLIVPAVDRAADILDVLKRERGEHGLSELARAIGANKGTVRQILVTLERHGLVQRNEDTKKYRLGYTMLEYARAVLRDMDLRRALRPPISELMDRTGETIIVSALDGNSTIIVDRAVPDADLRVYAPVGRRLPAIVGSMGKVLLAHAKDDELDEILTSNPLSAFTPKSIVDVDAYRSALCQVQETGYALDDEEYMEGVRGVSAPIVDHRGRVVAALSVVGFTVRMSDQRLPEIIAQTIDTAHRISARLGAPAD